MCIKGIRSEQLISQRPFAALLWFVAFEILLAAKAVLSYWSVPRYPDVILGNVMLAVLASAVLLSGFYARRRISWWTELAYLMLYIGYNVYEVTQLLPFAFGELGLYGLFIVSAVLNFSIVLAFVSLYRHIIIAGVTVVVEIFYVWMLISQIRDASHIFLWFFLLQVLVIFIGFRMLKVISAQHKESRQLLQTQKQLNERLTASSKRLVEQEKLISIALMSSELSHEINNPLTFLQGNLMFLKRDLDTLIKAVPQQDPTIREAIDDIEGILHEYKDGFYRIGEVIRRLKEFSSRSSQEPHSYNAAEVIESCVNLHNNLKRSKGIEIAADIVGPLRIVGRPADLLTLCSHLIENAKEALTAPPKDSTAPRGEPGYIRITARLQEDTFTFTVRDNGPGMDKTLQKDVAMPFFTTRNSGPNLGLGLSTCTALVQENNGHLSIESSPGTGTTVHVSLPAGENHE